MPTEAHGESCAHCQPYTDPDRAPKSDSLSDSFAKLYAELAITRALLDRLADTQRRIYALFAEPEPIGDRIADAVRLSLFGYLRLVVASALGRNP